LFFFSFFFDNRLRTEVRARQPPRQIRRNNVRGKPGGVHLRHFSDRASAQSRPMGILSNRAVSCKVSQQLKLSFQLKSFRFLTIMMRTEKEVNFKEVKAKYKSRYYWHGS
jgi:hypothetical protein